MGKHGIHGSADGLTAALYQRVAFWLSVFFLLVLIAFWSSYYGVLSRPMPGAVHFHGGAMTAWCVLLILQAVLIRTGKFRYHRAFGTLSYLLVPLILVSGAHLAHQTVLKAASRPDLYYHLIALMFNALLVFLIFYGLAIRYRKQPRTHARYMLSTVFPLVTPVTDRIIHKYIHDLVPHLPTIGGAPIAPIVGYLLTDLVVLGLLLWDWKAHRKLNVFPVVLIVLLIYQISVMTFYQYNFWRSIGDWIMRLPL